MGAGTVHRDVEAWGQRVASTCFRRALLQRPCTSPRAALPGPSYREGTGVLGSGLAGTLASWDRLGLGHVLRCQRSPPKPEAPRAGGWGYAAVGTLITEHKEGLAVDAGQVQPPVVLWLLPVEGLRGHMRAGRWGAAGEPGCGRARRGSWPGGLSAQPLAATGAGGSFSPLELGSFILP